MSLILACAELFGLVFFFKQKTAYEMRISDWSSDVCSSDLPGDNFDEIFAQDGVVGHDVFFGLGGFDEFIAEGGDDIMVGSPGRGKMAGMSGWVWAIYKNNNAGADAELTRGMVFDENPTPPQNATQDGYESVEGLSGSRFNDFPQGFTETSAERDVQRGW